jgi:hypothetical protein
MPAVSKAQQRFMGMVHAAQKGDMENPSPEVQKAADSISDKDAKDYSSTSNKGLPNKKENMITRNRLKEIVKEVMVEEAEYQAFFAKALEKAGKGINDMSDDEKKSFFNKIDSAWNGKGEKNEELTGNQHKLDVDKDGDIGSDDLADLRAGKKVDEATTSSAPGEWVAYLSMTRGKKLLKTFDTARGAKQFLSKNVDKLLGGANVESVGIMTKKQWDEREAKYAIESVNEDIATELPKATIPSAVKQKMDIAIDKIKDAKLSNVQKLQLVAQVVDSLGIDKSQLGTMASKIRSKMESVNETTSGKEIETLEKQHQMLAAKGSAIMDKQRQLIRTTLGGKFEFPWENYDKWPNELKMKVAKLDMEFEKNNVEVQKAFEKLMKAKGTWR